MRSTPPCKSTFRCRMVPTSSKSTCACCADATETGPRNAVTATSRVAIVRMLLSFADCPDERLSEALRSGVHPIMGSYRSRHYCEIRDPRAYIVQLQGATGTR